MIMIISMKSMVKESMISKPLLVLLIFTISLHQSMSMKKKIWDLWLPAIGLFRIRLLSQTRFLFARHDFQSLPLHHLIHTRAHMVWMMAEIIQLRIIMVPSSFGQLKIVKFLLNLCKWCRILLKYLPSKSLSLLDGSLQLPLLPHSRLVRNINSSLRSSILRLKSKGPLSVCILMSMRVSLFSIISAERLSQPIDCSITDDWSILVYS